jgi:hypothetical protein
MNPQQLLQTIADNLGVPLEPESNDRPTPSACPYCEIERRRREVDRQNLESLRASARPFFESLRDRLLESINAN